MKTFKEFLESSKKILLLIHPDCVFELGTEECEEYNKKIKIHYSKFDYVISHLFWPSHMVKYISEKRPNDSVFLHSILKTIKETSHIIPSSGCSFSQELPEYLIENDNATIFMAGGYEDNCLWRSYIDLFKKLDWLLKEKQTNVMWYRPLIFQAKHQSASNISDEEIEQDRLNLKFIDPKPSNFHRKKVDYIEEI